MMLNTNIAANEIVSLEVDSPTVVDFNPIRDESIYAITPTTRLGGEEISGSNVKYFFESTGERE